MMRIIYIALFSFCFLTGFSQNNPVFSKVTATWCPNCGTWGWDFMETMKDESSSGPVLPLGVHYSGDLENETASWWAANLNSSGQPRFYLNNQNISAGSSTWQAAVATTMATAEGLATTDQADFVFSTLFMENGILNATIDVQKTPDVDNNLYVGVYVYENNVENNQSQQGPNALHPNVLRATMSDDFQGQNIANLGAFDFTMDVDATWDEEELGVLAVIWEEDTNGFQILASKAVGGVAGLSSNEEILNSSDFNFVDNDTELIISTKNKDSYQLSFADMQGRLITTSLLQNEVTISKGNLVSGMYLATIRNGNQVLTQQIFVK